MDLDAHPPETVSEIRTKVGFIRRFVFSTDHKVIGIQYLVSSIVFMFAGGFLALLVRVQLGWPRAEIPLVGRWLWPESAGHLMPYDTYNMLFTMHATVMIFFVIIPFLNGAFGNYLIPLMIGAPDMAFPRLNRLSYWLIWPAFLCLACSFFVPGGAASSGWTAYPTIASLRMPEGEGLASPANMGASMGQILWLVALLFVGISSMLGSLNFITTIINARAPGLTFFRLPMTVWGLFITAILQALALPVLTVALILQLLDKTLNTCFFLPPAGGAFGEWAVGPGGGQPLLWLHLFWFYSHPAVYIMILPAMGMVSDILTVFARKPLFGYLPMVTALMVIAGLGFLVWGHHMYQSGMDPRLGTGFMLATIMIALPSAVKTFNWIATVWQGSLEFTTAMLFALAFVSMFVIGGLSGIFMAATPVDMVIHNTYVIVAHIHYVLFLSSLFGIFAACYYWYPKMFGRRMNEFWGRWHFALTFITANCCFYPMHILGIRGMPRRFAVPDEAVYLKPLQPLNEFVSIAAIAMGLAQLIFLANFVLSWWTGSRAGRNPWRANTLEWLADSPPPHGNFEQVPIVTRGPYEYSDPTRSPDDFAPQAEPGRNFDSVDPAVSDAS